MIQDVDFLTTDRFEDLRSQEANWAQPLAPCWSPQDLRQSPRKKQQSKTEMDCDIRII